MRSEGLGGGAQHRPDQMRAGAGRGEDVGEEEALGDLEALLVRQPALALRGHLGRARDQAGIALGGGGEQLLVAKRPATSRR